MPIKSDISVSKSDQIRTLILTTIAFTASFAVWTIFSIIGIQIKTNLGLNETEFGLLVGTPILTGSLIRLILGIWTDIYGGRIVLTLLMLASALATWLLSGAETYPQFLLAGLGVGIAGGTFIAAVAYVSRWFDKKKQGLPLGIIGAGNVGAAVTKFLAPVVMVALGWAAVAKIWAVALAALAIIFWIWSKDDPVLRHQKATGEKPQPALMQLAPLKNLQVWRFSLYYFFVFGAFVALALWLPKYFVSVYGVSIITAGMLGAMYSIPGSLFRIFGGWLSDKAGERVGIALGMVLMSSALFVLVNIPAGNQWMYYLGWGLAGMGAGVSGPAYQSLISKAVPQKNRGMAFGLFSTSLGIFSLPAPWIGAQMWDRVSPTFPFTVTAIVLLISVIPIWLKFKLPKVEVEAISEEIVPAVVG